MGTPNREPKEYSRNIMEDEDPSRYIPNIFLLYSWVSLFGVPSKVHLPARGEVSSWDSISQLVPRSAAWHQSFLNQASDSEP